MALKTQFPWGKKQTNKQTTNQYYNQTISTFEKIMPMGNRSKTFKRISGFFMKEILQEIFPVGIIPHSQLILHCQAATSTSSWV